MKRPIIAARVQFLIVAAQRYQSMMTELTVDSYRAYIEGARDALESALGAWQSRWNLNDAWVREIVLQTFTDWRFFRGRVGAEWCGSGTAVPANWPRFTSAPWYPDVSREDFERATIVALRRWIGAVERERRERASKWGAKSEESDELDIRSPEHLDWLARYQVGREGMGDIWRSLQSDSRTRRAVEQAIQRSAEGIGLTLRT